jgi:hypothetical protein
MSNIQFKSTPHPRMLHLRDGIITFLCTCGRQGVSNLSSFTKLTRCLQCTRVNSKIKSCPTKYQKKLIFLELYPYLVEDI